MAKTFFCDETRDWPAKSFSEWRGSFATCSTVLRGSFFLQLRMGTYIVIFVFSLCSLSTLYLCMFEFAHSVPLIQVFFILLITKIQDVLMQSLSKWRKQVCTCPSVNLLANFIIIIALRYLNCFRTCFTLLCFTLFELFVAFYLKTKVINMIYGDLSTDAPTPNKNVRSKTSLQWLVDLCGGKDNEERERARVREWVVPWDVVRVF